MDQRRRRSNSLAVLACAALLAAGPVAAAPARGSAVRFDDRALPAALRAIEIGHPLSVAAVPLFPGESGDTSAWSGGG